MEVPESNASTWKMRTEKIVQTSMSLLKLSGNRIHERTVMFVLQSVQFIYGDARDTYDHSLG